MTTASLLADDWDPHDDTFDPSIHSVVVGDASWLGDPSPFIHTGLRRTGYTHVNQVEWEGFDPSVQISLMVPLHPGEATPPAGGMLMMNESQTSQFIKVFDAGLKADPSDKRITIKTGFKDADWALTFASEKGQRFLQLENKSKDKVDIYRFSTNASKKLLGAIRHSMKKLQAMNAEK